MFDAVKSSLNELQRIKIKIRSISDKQTVLHENSCVLYTLEIPIQIPIIYIAIPIQIPIDQTSPNFSSSIIIFNLYLAREALYGLTIFV